MPEPPRSAAISAEAAASDSPRAALTPARAGAVLASGLAGALLVPGVEAGLGLALACVAGGSVALVRRTQVDAYGSALAVAALALAMTPLLRDADWLVAANVSLAAVLAVFAITGVSSWTALVANLFEAIGGLLAAPMAVIRSALAAVPRGAGYSLASPFRGAAIGSGLVLIFGLLFASADSAFSELVSDLTPDQDAFSDLPAKIVVAALIVAVVGAIGLQDRTVPPPAVPEPGFLRPTEWGLALGPVVLLFATFVAVQFAVLFGGNEHVLETAGLTYSEYAREGFTQLLIVAGLAVGLIAAAWRWSLATTPRELRLLRALLGAICLLTLVVLVSALHRLDLYAEAFGATHVRLVAALACVWIGGLVAMIAVAVARWQNGWLPKAVVAFTAIVALGFTFMNPDGFIADRNVDRFADEGKFDTVYNSTLSADATPALADLPEELATPTLSAQREALAESDGWRAFNFSRDSARAALSP